MERRVHQAKPSRNATVRPVSLGRALLVASLVGLGSSCRDDQTPTQPLHDASEPQAPNVVAPRVVVDRVPDSVKTRALAAASVGGVAAADPASALTVRGALTIASPSANLAAATDGPLPTATAIPFAPESGQAANLGPACDDCVMLDVPIGFSFSFFGNTYDRLDISSNGFVRFGDVPTRSASGCCAGLPIPSAENASLDNMISIAWLDLLPTQSGMIRYETRGTAPNRRFLVQLVNVPECCSTTGTQRINAQLILYEGTNVAELHTAAQIVDRHVVTQGVENLPGTLAAFIPGRVAAMYNLTNDAVRFTTAGENRVPVASAGGSVGGVPADHYEGAEGSPIAFAGSGSDPDGDALTYAWDFDGDGRTDATAAAASHAYADNGDYTARLTVTDARGGSAVATVPVHVDNAAPTVAAGADLSVAAGRPLTLDASFSDAGVNDGAWSYTVLWGDDAGGVSSTTGTVNEQARLAPSHTYAAPGVYTVTVTVRDKDGGEGSDTLTITVSNHAPVAVAGGNAGGPPADHYEGVEGQAVQFDASASHDDDADALSFYWDFDNDGVADATTAVARHTYGDDGSFSATLTVIDRNGGSAAVTVPVVIANANPTATLVLPTAALAEGTPFALSLSGATDVAADAGSLAYAFDCGQGYQAAGASPAATCTPADNGSLAVRAKVQDKDGGVSEYSGTIAVANVDPTGVFTAPSGVTVGSPIVLGFSSATDPGSADVATLQSLFDCGAGEGFTPGAVCATSAVGTRNVSGRLRDKDGGESTYGPVAVSVSAAATSTSLDNASAQYGDPVSLSATLTSSAGAGAGSPAGTMEFLLGGASVGTVPVLGTGAVTLAPLPGTRAPGSYSLSATYRAAEGGNFLGSTSSAATLAVAKENVATEYTGDLFVAASGTGATTGTVRLAAKLTQDPDGYPADLTLARVRFELYGSSNGSPAPDQVVDNVAVDASGNAETSVSLAGDSWRVRVVVPAANPYWVANPVGTSTFVVALVYDGTHVTGGGWLTGTAGDQRSFSFVVNSARGSVPKGGVQYVFRGADGYDYNVKTTTWDGGGLTFFEDVARASFTSSASVQKIDPTTGRVIATARGYRVTVDMVDGDQYSPRSADRLAITVLDPADAVWHQLGSRTAPVAIGGGNVRVHGSSSTVTSASVTSAP